MTNMLEKDPQNPYESFIIEASAGSGKTYQLSKRFLFLVGAGADPSSILTITFTVKAASEMRSRIIDEALSLLYSQKESDFFIHKLKLFYQQIKNSNNSIHSVYQKPRTAFETAGSILASTQSLRICTIDSVFYQWSLKFPIESNLSKDVNKIKMVSDPLDIEHINTKAWQSVLKEKPKRNIFFGIINELKEQGFSIDIIKIQKRVSELHRYETFLDFIKNNRLNGYVQYEEDLSQVFTDCEIFEKIKDHLTLIAAQTNKEYEILNAIRQRSLRSLISLRILTKSLEVSKQTIRGKKREKLLDSISYVEDHLIRWNNQRKKIKLNNYGQSIFRLYDLWKSQRDQTKMSMGVVEFSDLSKGAFRLFCDDANIGVQWLLKKSIKHLMMDEFQDTSLMQWQVFLSLSQEILSGFGESSDDPFLGSVFLVGDKKQSIYGFREADPKVIELGKDFLLKMGGHVFPMSINYRSTQTVLNAVNQVFSLLMPNDFPVHKAAKSADGNYKIPNYSEVVVHPTFQVSDTSSLTPLEKEADYVSSFISEALSGIKKYLVYDFDTKSMRSLQAKDCCLLYRNSTHVEVFEKFLRKKNISFIRSEKKGFFIQPEIKDILALFKYLVDPNDLTSLLTVMLSPLGDLDESFLYHGLDLCKSIKAPYRAIKYRSILLKKKSKIMEAIVLLEKRINISSSLLLHCVFSELNFLKKYKNAGFDGNVLNANIDRISEIVLEIENKEHGNFISCVKKLIQMSKVNQTGLRSSSSNSVQLMTIHKAKGLEFPFVAVVESSNLWYRFDHYWIKRDAGLSYVDVKENIPLKDLEFDRVVEGCRRNMDQEAKRLLYVALTRASQYLLITGHESSMSKGGGFHDRISKSFSKNTKGDYNELVLANKDDHGLVVKNEHESKRKLDFVVCHKEFSDNSLPKNISIINPHQMLHNRYPLSKDNVYYGFKLTRSEIIYIGTFIHKVFEVFFKNKEFVFELLWDEYFGNQCAKSSVVRVDVILKIKENIKNELKSSLSSEFFINLLKKSIKIVPEMDFLMLDGNNLISGKIDLVAYFENNTILVIDYKTSFLEKRCFKSQCKEKSYDKQISFYIRFLQRMEKKATIKGGVWLSKHLQYVELF